MKKLFMATYPVGGADFSERLAPQIISKTKFNRK
jgi:hypothetical protein